MFWKRIHQAGIQRKGLAEANEQLDVLKLDDQQRQEDESWEIELHQRASMVKTHYGRGFREGMEKATADLVRNMLKNVPRQTTGVQGLIWVASQIMFCIVTAIVIVASPVAHFREVTKDCCAWGRVQSLLHFFEYNDWFSVKQLYQSPGGSNSLRV